MRAHADRTAEWPRVVAFGGGAGLRQLFGGLVAFGNRGGGDRSDRLTAVVGVSQREVRVDAVSAQGVVETIDTITLDADTAAGGETRSLRLRRPPRPVPELIRRIVNADVIVVGPGSLYTNVLPALVGPGVASTIAAVNAVRVYVANLMTEPGETEGMDLAGHLDAIAAHAGVNLFDYALVNRRRINRPLIGPYCGGSARPIVSTSIRWPITTIERELAATDISGRILHDRFDLGDAILELAYAGRPPASARLAS